MKNCLVIGNGWLGNIIKDYLGATMSKLRLESISSVDLSGYDVVINCAGETDVDYCETEKWVAYHNNTEGVKNLAIACEMANVLLMQMSSGCIYDSTMPVYENDIPNPKSWYATTKMIAEQTIFDQHPDTIAVRLRMPISSTPHQRNLLNKLKKYDKVHEVPQSITVVEDMLPKLKELIKERRVGIHHMCNKGTISMAEIKDLMGDKFAIVRKEEIKQKAQRADTVMGNSILPNIHTRIEKIINKWSKLCV